MNSEPCTPKSAIERRLEALEADRREREASALRLLEGLREINRRSNERRARADAQEEKP
jgi:hypothetical protein